MKNSTLFKRNNSQLKFLTISFIWELLKRVKGIDVEDNITVLQGDMIKIYCPYFY